MSCGIFRERLQELFGQADLPGDVAQHLTECQACREYWQELCSRAEQLGDDRLFHISDELADRLTARVEERLTHRAPVRKATVIRLRPWWSRVAAVAAAAAVILAVSLNLFDSQPEQETTLSETELLAALESSYTQQAADDELDQPTVQALLYDFTSQHASYSSELLLDDLTDEELEYLEQNFDVKELL